MSPKLFRIICAMALIMTPEVESWALKLSTEGTAMGRKLSRLNAGFFDKLLNSAALKGLSL